MKDALQKTKGNPKKRMEEVYNVCKGRTICEGGPDLDTKKDEEGSVDDKKKVRYCAFVSIISSPRFILYCIPGIHRMWQISAYLSSQRPGPNC